MKWNQTRTNYVNGPVKKVHKNIPLYTSYFEHQLSLQEQEKKQ